MKLIDLLKTKADCIDTYDNTYDAIVTCSLIDEPEDNYDKFCTFINENVEVIDAKNDICDWEGFILSHKDKFMRFAEENWYEGSIPKNEDDFVYSWINELHSYLAGNISDKLYGEFLELFDEATQEKITVNFGNLLSEMKNKEFNIVFVRHHISNGNFARGFYIEDKAHNIYSIETYYHGSYLDKFIKNKENISFEKIKLLSPEAWKNTPKEVWGISEVADFIKRQELNINEYTLISQYGSEYTIVPELHLYEAYDGINGIDRPTIAIQLYSKDSEGLEPYSVLTVNLGEYIGVKNCAYIDTNNNGEHIVNWLEEIGAGKKTSFTKTSGFCEYPLFAFNEDFLKSIDTNGNYDKYSKSYDDYMSPLLDTNEPDICDE